MSFARNGKCVYIPKEQDFKAVNNFAPSLSPFQKINQQPHHQCFHRPISPKGQSTECAWLSKTHIHHLGSNTEGKIRQTGPPCYLALPGRCLRVSPSHTVLVGSADVPSSAISSSAAAGILCRLQDEVFYKAVNYQADSISGGNRNGVFRFTDLVCPDYADHH